MLCCSILYCIVFYCILLYFIVLFCIVLLMLLLLLLLLLLSLHSQLKSQSAVIVGSFLTEGNFLESAGLELGRTLLLRTHRLVRPAFNQLSYQDYAVVL